MSQWTHVNCILRIDCILETLNKKKILRGIDPPEGSEGPLHVTLWTNPISNHLAAHTLAIFGDLRDYDDKQEILECLTKICEKRIIRSGVCEIQIEYVGTYLYQYSEGKWIHVG